MSEAHVLLIAEDEPIIRMMMQDAFEDGRYVVITASNGTDALEHLEIRALQLSGFVTDIRLAQGPDGWELARHARTLNPDIAVLYVTGDSASEWRENGVHKSVVIQKPFAEIQLVTAISQLLGQ